MTSNMEILVCTPQKCLCFYVDLTVIVDMKAMFLDGL